MGYGWKEQAALYPPSLKKGDQVCIIDPANAFTAPAVDAIRKELEAAGFLVVLSEDMAFKRGTPKERARKLNAVLRQKENRGIFCVWGGYGSMLLLDWIDYEAVRENRPVFIGYSDITAIHLALEKHTGLVTFHGPSFYSPSRPTTPAAKEDLLQKISNIGKETEIQNLNGERIQAFREGVCQGTLTGGNLTLICRLMGTPYEIETEGKVLFFEEIGERPYRLHGMLSQLKMAGKLDACAGVMVGALNQCDEKGRPGSAQEAVQDVLGSLSVPVVSHVRAGHIGDSLTLPLHGLCKIDGSRVAILAASRQLTDRTAMD